MKLLIVLCLTASLAVIAEARDAAWGQRTSNDSLIFTEHVVELPGTPNTETFIVVHKKVPNKITAIFVKDNFPNKSGAVPTIAAGGVGSGVAVLVLQGKQEVGYNSNVEIYAY